MIPRGLEPETRHRKLETEILRECHLNYLSQMQRLPPRTLRNLLAATEAVSNDQRIRRSLSHSRQQFEYPNGHRHFVFLFLNPERPRHAATPRGRSVKIDPHFFKYGFLIGHLHDRFVMAMPVQQSFTRQFRKHEVFSFFLQKFAEKKRLPRKFLSTRDRKSTRLNSSHLVISYAVFCLKK